MSKIDREEQLANPDVSTLVTPEKMYRNEMLAVLCWMQDKSVSDLRKMRKDIQITDGQVAAIKRELRNQTTNGLENRIAALQKQNPGLLMEAMKACGFNITKDAAGDVRIDVDPSSNMGRYISPEEFEKIAV